MPELAEYMKHKELGFVVKTEPGLGKIKFNDDWIVALPEDELLIFTGKVVHDPNNIWGTEKESRNWGFTAFEASSKFQADIYGSRNEFWEVTDIGTGDVFEGNIIHLNSPDERAKAVEIEWDSDLPEYWEDIEEQINKLI